jgi:hypothetical protein
MSSFIKFLTLPHVVGEGVWGVRADWAEKRRNDAPMKGKRIKRGIFEVKKRPHESADALL